MILKHKLLEKYDEYVFKIPLENGDRVLVEKGNKITEGTNLLMRSNNSISHTFYLPDQLDIKISNIQEYLTCIDGEFVKEGDVLAQRVNTGGLTLKTLVSPVSGIVDLSRVKNGYIDILGEEDRQMVESKFSADILDVNPLDGITVRASAQALDLLSISNTRKENISGEFICLNTGKSIRLKAENQSYRGKIVFAGKHLHKELLRDLFEKGAVFVLTYSMDYTDFREQGLPVGVIGGFGEIHSSDEILSEIEKLSGSFAVADLEESQMFFLKKKSLGRENSSVFVKSLIGSKIISHASGSYGLQGEIVGVEDGGYVMVDWKESGTGVVNLGCTEFISYT